MATWTATDTVTGLSDKVTVPDPVVVATSLDVQQYVETRFREVNPGRNGKDE